MKLIAGCPVANRAWIIPRWMECLAGQTRRPDKLVFVHSTVLPKGEIQDATWLAVSEHASRWGFDLRLEHSPLPYRPRHKNPPIGATEPSLEERFAVLTETRNKLLSTVQGEDADLFLSLDSDILLERPDVIERLLQVMDEEEGADLVSPMTFLHPMGALIETSPQICWAYNAGWWCHDVPRTHYTALKRPPPENLKGMWGGRVEIDIPMAIWLGNRRVLDCRYRWHPAGEDLGFAASLEEHGLLSVWDTSIKVRHMWCENDLMHIKLLEEAGQWIGSLEAQGM